MYLEPPWDGYFGLTNVKPGRYRVWTDGADPARTREILVEAGKVTRADL
ncbi:MAG: carboxypeptidase regulatory-like domain-containing protein [Acidobacteria bacterium]|nr:carboxypeptidase regulatory-like domain-containing protein [Acidobacteriota bacterium]